MKGLGFWASVLMIILGVGLSVAAIFVSEARLGLLIASGSVILAGVINLLFNRFFSGLMEGFPKPKGFGESMRDSAKSFSEAAEMLKQQNRAMSVQMSGLNARVDVVSMRDTGQMINYDPVLEFDLLVTVGDQPQYSLMRYRQVVSKILIARISVGQTYNAKVDPNDKKNLYISWT